MIQKYLILSAHYATKELRVYFLSPNYVDTCCLDEATNLWCKFEWHKVTFERPNLRAGPSLIGACRPANGDFGMAYFVSCKSLEDVYTIIFCQIREYCAFT